MKKDENLKKLKTSLSDLLSYDNNTKYGPKNKNRYIISNIKNTNDDKIKRLLNMNLSEWINIYLFKLKAEYEITFNGCNQL